MNGAPGDVILLISQLFTSPCDFVSFGMLNKRNYALLLEHIQEFGHKQAKALDMFTEVVMIRADDKYMISLGPMLLPSRLSHGLQQTWEPENWKTIKKELNEIFHHKLRIISDQDQIDRVLAVLDEQHDGERGLVMRKENHFFGSKEGKMYEESTLNLYANAPLRENKTYEWTTVSEGYYKNNLLEGEVTRRNFTSSDITARDQYRKGIICQSEEWFETGVRSHLTKYDEIGRAVEERDWFEEATARKLDIWTYAQGAGRWEPSLSHSRTQFDRETGLIRARYYYANNKPAWGEVYNERGELVERVEPWNGMFFPIDE